MAHWWLPLHSTIFANSLKEDLIATQLYDLWCHLSHGLTLLSGMHCKSNEGQNLDDDEINVKATIIFRLYGDTPD